MLYCYCIGVVVQCRPGGVGGDRSTEGFERTGRYLGGGGVRWEPGGDGGNEGRWGSPTRRGRPGSIVESRGGILVGRSHSVWEKKAVLDRWQRLGGAGGYKPGVNTAERTHMLTRCGRNRWAAGATTEQTCQVRCCKSESGVNGK